ncbi:helix-turn-helix transcriptional regulator [Candidatus Woesearchaeota archaeon]|nr:helix-turn-helix transcriptional regulator [Candidatus Woesearchaeota archaeon]
MTKVLQQYTIRKLKEPTEKQLDSDVEWVCNSLGFITPRDQDKTAYRILKAVIKASKNGSSLTSEELARVVKPTVGSVIYHLKRLMKAGLIVKIDSGYELRMHSLLATINEVEREVLNALEFIKKIAGDVDDQVGLNHREG